MSAIFYFFTSSAFQYAVIILLMVLFPMWNGYSINFMNNANNSVVRDENSKKFHAIGFVIRVLLLLLLLGSGLWFLLGLNLSWLAYDMIISKIMGQGYFYIGKTSEIDKKIGLYGFIGKGVVLLGTIIYIICITHILNVIN